MALYLSKNANIGFDILPENHFMVADTLEDLGEMIWGDYYIFTDDPNGWEPEPGTYTNYHCFNNEDFGNLMIVFRVNGDIPDGYTKKNLSIKLRNWSGDYTQVKLSVVGIYYYTDTHGNVETVHQTVRHYSARESISLQQIDDFDYEYMIIRPVWSETDIVSDPAKKRSIQIRFRYS